MLQNAVVDTVQGEVLRHLLERVLDEGPKFNQRETLTGLISGLNRNGTLF